MIVSVCSVVGSVFRDPLIGMDMSQASLRVTTLPRCQVLPVPDSEGDRSDRTA